MGQDETFTRVSNTLSTKEVANTAEGGLVDMTTAYQVILSSFDVTTMERATIQIRNVDNSYTLTAQVFGSIYPSPSGVGAASPTVDSYWVQIGDDIAVGTSSGSLKTISTTGLKRLAVRMKASNASMGNFPADDCLVFCQGRV